MIDEIIGAFAIAFGLVGTLGYYLMSTNYKKDYNITDMKIVSSIIYSGLVLAIVCGMRLLILVI